MFLYHISYTVNAEAEEEDGIPDDEELFKILTDSMDAINRKDIEAFRSLVHQDSPAYQDSMEVLKSIQDMDTEGNITEMSIEEKNEESITIYVEQEMAFLDGIGQNNQSKVIYELRPEDEEWKNAANTNINPKTLFLLIIISPLIYVNNS